MMTPLFLFDCDGTLTPSRGKINEDFRLWLCDFAHKHECHLVTGSDQPKTIEQLGVYCYNAFKSQFQCNGNEIYEGSDKLVSSSEWTIPDECKAWLSSILEQSSFPVRTGNHLEERNGMVNFSIVGRNATTEDRQLYVKFDKDNNERVEVSNEFNYLFSEKHGVKSTVGGETGLDITPIGKDKSQVLKHFEDREIYFFGDACQLGGNDYPLASVIIEKNLGFVYNVTDYKQTFDFLKEIDNALP